MCVCDGEAGAFKGPAMSFRKRCQEPLTEEIIYHKQLTRVQKKQIQDFFWPPPAAAGKRKRGGDAGSSSEHPVNCA